MYPTRVLRWPLLAALLLSLALGACDGQDGQPGPIGTPGPEGPPPPVPTTSAAESLSVSVSGVTLANPALVEFTVANEDGVRFAGLAAGNLRFGLAKLIPGQYGAPDRWQSYISRSETPPAPGAAPNDWPGTTPQLQATTDTGGTLLNHGDGRYSYRFGSSLSDIEPGLSHRLLVRISGTDGSGDALPLTNFSHDWLPATGATVGIRQREIVETASCNECHGQLTMHGGGYREVKACVVCHNPGSTDANSGHTLDFKVLVHKLHRGKDLPSVKAGGSYDIWGHANGKFEFGKIGYPQDIRNCSKCHDEADTATPQAANWKRLPSREACGACHEDVNFDSGLGHGPENRPAANGDCGGCHNPSNVDVARAHESPLRSEAAKYRYTIVNASLLADVSGATAGFPVVTYKVSDPTNADTPYDLVADADPADPAWAASHLGSRLRIDIGWSTADYRNQGHTDAYGRPADALWLNALAPRSGFNALPVANADGSYTVTSLIGVPLGVGTLAVVMEGYPAAAVPDPTLTWGDRVPVKTAVTYVAVSDSVPIARREVVDIAKCNQCHGQLSKHGNSRTDEPQACVVCHNTSNTDIAWRPADAADAPDGKKEEALDFKSLIHGLHAAGYRDAPLAVFGLHGLSRSFDADTMHFPGFLSDCNACHKPGTFGLPLASSVAGTTIDSGVLRASAEDDLKITPMAAVCSSCHDNVAAKAHMQLSGASFESTQSSGSYELCDACHGAGRLFDVATAHQPHMPAPHSAALALPRSPPRPDWSRLCVQCHDPATLAPEREVEAARPWMREVGPTKGKWVTRGSHGQSDLGRCLDCHQPQTSSEGSLPCNFCHAYETQPQKHQWQQKFAYPPGADPTQPADCAGSCHNWVNGDVVSLGFLNLTGDPEQSTYRGTVRPGELLLGGSTLHSTENFQHGGCAFCHNRGTDKSWHGREPVDLANPEGEYKSTVPNCVDCHSYQWTDDAGLPNPGNLHSTHATLVGAEMPATYPDGFDRGVTACDLCHSEEEGKAACWNCHLSGHDPKVPYWKLPQ